MSRDRSILPLVFVIAALGGCSRENPPPAPAAYTASKETPAPPAAPPPAAPAPTAPEPPTAGVLKSGDTNFAGVAAEVTECKRKEGVLSMRVRFRNTTAEEKRFSLIDGRNYEKYYLTAGSKKYFILKDSEGTYLTPEASSFGDLTIRLKAGEQYTWWAKYPAPSADVKAVTLYTPVSPPFEDIAVSDQ